MNVKREMAISWAALIVVTISLGFFFATLAQSHHSRGRAVETLVFVSIVLLLVLGNLVYQVARIGYLRRCSSHQPARLRILEVGFEGALPELSVLIPSYKEEARVLLQTVLSAALLQYPKRRVVALLDDPPNSSGGDLAALNASRNLINELNESFSARQHLLLAEYSNFSTKAHAGPIDLTVESAHLANLYDQVADWLDSLAKWTASLSGPENFHTDRFFNENILQKPAIEYRACAAGLRSGPLDANVLCHKYRALIALVTVEISTFERKRYVNLSHQPNKAMNLNSYIGLIGRHYQEVNREDGLHLIECPASEASLFVPPAEYLLTLDADSVVLPDYALRLIQIMQKDCQIAVAQTPYSAFPAAPGVLERVAGATTDVQYIVHQGFTHFNATYWVGANAILRTSALQEICGIIQERGHRIPVYIEDRTVIEDTGSTITLVERGWRLYNHPERLAYSATPPDFGSLIIQRRRWSNGGLIILPNLIRHLWKNGRSVRCLPEMLLRAHYLISPAVGNFGLLVLLLYSFDDALTTIWLPLSAAPYYFLYGRDLRIAGYRWLDLFRVYALNLILIPVNLAGVLRSLQQLATGKKAAFGRTPKVQARTTISPLHVAFQILFLAYLIYSFVIDFFQGHYSHAAFGLASSIVYFYGVSRFIGWREGYADLRRALFALSGLRSGKKGVPSQAVRAAV